MTTPFVFSIELDKYPITEQASYSPDDRAGKSVLYSPNRRTEKHADSGKNQNRLNNCSKRFHVRSFQNKTFCFCLGN